MHSRTTRVTTLLATALLCLGTLACSSGGPASVEPPAPTKKPFVAPEWDSTEFRSEDGGMFVHYPSDFESQPLQGPTAMLSAASPSLVPRVDVNRADGVASTTLEEMGASVESQMAQLGGGESKVTSMKDVTLRDGVTKAMEFDVNWSFQGFPLSSVVLIAPVKDYHVNLTVTGMDGGDREELADIAYTLTIP